MGIFALWILVSLAHALQIKSFEKRQLIEVNNNYLDFVQDLAGHKDLMNSRLKPKEITSKKADESLVNEGVDQMSMSSAELMNKIGVDLKDEQSLRVNLES